MNETSDLAHWTMARDEPVVLPHGKPIPTTVRGFMWARELIHLNVVAYDLRERGVPGGVLEVGSYCGLSACALAQPGPLTCVDTFRDAWKPEDRHAYTRPEFDANMKLMGLRPRVIERNSREALPMLRDRGEKFRLILIDAGHAYLEAKTDIQNAVPLLSPGGALVIDDWTQDEVKRAALDSALTIALPKGGKLAFAMPA